MTKLRYRQTLNRRSLLTGLSASLLLPGCANLEPKYRTIVPVIDLPPDPYGDQLDQTYEPSGPMLSDGPSLDAASINYASVIDDGFEIPAIPYEQIDPKYYRQSVADPTGEAPGTIVVDTANRFLYLVQEQGEAIRYGAGIGREGFAWSGRAIVQWKKKWPTWTPPAQMIARDPKLEKYSAANGGQPPGITNPLGARALYIFKDGKDTLYRIHGSPEWKSIGTAASSGCVRLINQDVIDLYDRVSNKTPVVVLDANSPLASA